MLFNIFFFESLQFIVAQKKTNPVSDVLFNIFFLSVSSVYAGFLPNHNEYIYYNKIHKRSQYDN